MAGPSRPPLPQPPPPPKQPVITWGKPPEEPVKPMVVPATMVPKRTAIAKQKSAARVTGERTDVYVLLVL